MEIFTIRLLKLDRYFVGSQQNLAMLSTLLEKSTNIKIQSDG